MERTDGGPAFPVVAPEVAAVWEGASLRDLFAGLAMAGELASQSGETGVYCDRKYFPGLAEGSYQIADAMLEARKANAT